MFAYSLKTFSLRRGKILDVKHHSSINSALDNLQRQSIALGAVLSRRILSLQASVLTELEDTSSNVLKLKNSLETLAEESKNSVEQLRFLKSLRFPELQNRYSAIMDAHTNTLDWAFDESKSKLVAWLREGSGIFWATGLAGSGKSTFMKLIATHDTTRDLLQTWASGSRLITGNYFFWNLGSAMQKSQQGLLQSLLFQILRQDLELIPILCPGRDTILPWTKTELCKVFEQLSCTDLGDRKFCFFIDGLDEYEGEEEEVIQVISQLATSPHIKICTSSRPWNAFRYAFGETEYTLSMQDLTAKDIAAYVDAELINHPAFKKCVEEDER
ncbi:bifunctional epoxide hydrolase 2 [Apiospora arundinis]